jgi:hypothetical protein
VEEKLLGTAFGVLTMMQNVLTVVIPPINGFIKDRTSSIHGGYTWVEVSFVCISFMGLLTQLCVYIWDVKKRGNLLQSKDPGNKFNEYLTREIRK